MGDYVSHFDERVPLGSYWYDEEKAGLVLHAVWTRYGKGTWMWSRKGIECGEPRTCR